MDIKKPFSFFKWIIMQEFYRRVIVVRQGKKGLLEIRFGQKTRNLETFIYLF